MSKPKVTVFVKEGDNIDDIKRLLDENNIKYSVISVCGNVELILYIMNKYKVRRLPLIVSDKHEVIGGYKALRGWAIN